MQDIINQVAQQIKSKIGNHEPKIGINLGSGLGGMAEAIEIPSSSLMKKSTDFPVPPYPVTPVGWSSAS